MSRRHSGICRTVAIIAPGDDPHAVAVRRRVRQLYGDSVDCRIIDAATFPIASDIDFNLDGHQADVLFRVSEPLAGTIGNDAPCILSGRDLEQRHCFSGKEVSSVWWRRARHCIAHPDVQIDDFQSFCTRTMLSHIKAALTLLPTHNPIDVEEAASRKPYQLMLATRLGLRIPRTLITCDAKAAMAFVKNVHAEDGEVIYKHASSVAFISMPTRVLSRKDSERLGDLRYSPAIFQERVTGGVDLRVAVVGRQVFVCEWRCSGGNPDAVDIRFEHDVRMWATPCSSELRDQVLSLHKALGLTFGVYDFKRDDSGDLFFLEVNPSGQWLDMEIEGGHSLSEHWARVLVEGATKGASELEPFTMTDLQAEKKLQIPIPVKWTRVEMID